MNSTLLLDWLAGFVSQIIEQCQFWCVLGCLAVGLAVLMGVGVAMYQLIETLDGNGMDQAVRH